MSFDPEFSGFWLADYIPEIAEIDRPIFPKIEEFQALPGAVTIETVPIPHNCTDGFMCAYWRRPEAYLDADVRSAISTFSKIDNVSQGPEETRVRSEVRRLEKEVFRFDWIG